MSKKLIISLDDDIQFTHLSYNSTLKAIHDNVKLIVTPCVEFFSTMYTNDRHGYKVYVRNKEKEICLNDMLLKKEIRFSQDSVNMLLSGVFNVYPDEY